MAPDLRASPVVASFDSLVDIVRNGARKERGMPQFPDFSDEYILAVQHYIRMRAERALEE